ncbi:MAG: aldo/keto reductase [Spirochaetales bacterium]|nr:aldo/keto reductase [Spirochaetales bacterium]
MKRIPLANIDQESSCYILGTWAFGDKFWGDHSHKDTIKTIHAALRLGINHFDTAQSYGNGIAEQIIGQQLRKEREKYIISTKQIATTPEKLEKELQASMKRLFSEYIDIFYIHWPSSQIEARPMFEKLLELKEKKIIKAIGLSNFSLQQISKLQEIGKIDIVQECYNLIWRRPEDGIIPYCLDYGINFAAYSPLAHGILSGEYPSLTKKINKYRQKTVFFEEKPQFYINIALEKFRNLAKEANLPPAALALKWIETRPSMPLTIFGAKTRAQLEANLSLAEKVVETEILAKVDEIFITAAKKMPKDAKNIFRHNP